MRLVRRQHGITGATSTACAAGSDRSGRRPAAISAPSASPAAKDIVAGSVCGTKAASPARRVSGRSAPRVSCKVTSASSCRACSARSPRLPFGDFAGLGRTPPRQPVRLRPASRRQALQRRVVLRRRRRVDRRHLHRHARRRSRTRPASATCACVKQSAVDPTQKRVLDTVIWYPTTPGAGPIETGSRAVLDAPLDLGGGPYPVLMFSHGSCGFARRAFLDAVAGDARLHRRGAAASGQHAVRVPDLRHAAGAGRVGGRAPARHHLRARPHPRRQRRSLSPFFGAIDADRIGMSGHSFGGLTTYLDDRDRRPLQGRDADGTGVRTDAAAHHPVADDARRDRHRGRAFPAIRRRLRPLERAQASGRDRERRPLRVLRRLLPGAGLQPADDADAGRGARARAALGAAVPEGLPRRRPELRPFLTTAPPPGVQVSSK